MCFDFSIQNRRGKQKKRFGKHGPGEAQAANHSARHQILIFPNPPETKIILELLHVVR
jgi:hypothetical protein